MASSPRSNYQSLMDHVGNGKDWDLARKRGGLRILPPFGHANSGIYRGRLEALFGAMSFIRHSLSEYVSSRTAASSPTWL